MRSSNTKHGFPETAYSARRSAVEKGCCAPFGIVRSTATPNVLASSAIALTNTRETRLPVRCTATERSPQMRFAVAVPALASAVDVEPRGAVRTSSPSHRALRYDHRLVY